MKHKLMSIKDLLCYLCLCGAEVENWFLRQEIAGSNTVIFAIFPTIFTECVESTDFI